MGLLVFLIFQDNNSLKKHQHGHVFRLERRVTYEANIPSGDDERSASQADKTQLPYEDETKDGTRDNSGDGLNNSRGAELISMGRKRDVKQRTLQE